MTLPRALSLAPDSRLCSAPARELSRLRGDHWRAESVSLRSGVDVALPVAGSRLEIAALVQAGDASVIGLRLRVSPDGREMTVLSVDVATGRITFDRTAASSAPDTMPGTYGGVDGWLPGERIRLHVFIDESIIELFVNDAVTLTGRIYPTRTDSLGIAAFALGGAAEFEAIDIWQLDVPAAADLRSR